MYASEDRSRTGTVWRRLAQLFLLTTCSVFVFYANLSREPREGALPLQRQRTIEKCRLKERPAGPSPDFHDRETSDRFQPGSPPVLILNARIWTGARNGSETISGDILLKDGLIAAIIALDGETRESSQEDLVHTIMQDAELEVVDAKGRWVTPGYYRSLLRG